jgi:hypothetical protein
MATKLLYLNDECIFGRKEVNNITCINVKQYFILQ